MAMRVLLVDDENELRELWTEILQARGYEVAQARTMAEVRQHIDAGLRFDVAVVDWSLPDGRGSDVRRALHATDAKLPVIFASGFGPMLPPDHGGDGVLSKPFRTRDLIAMIDRLVG